MRSRATENCTVTYEGDTDMTYFFGNDESYDIVAGIGNVDTTVFYVVAAGSSGTNFSAGAAAPDNVVKSTEADFTTPNNFVVDVSGAIIEDAILNLNTDPATLELALDEGVDAADAEDFESVTIRDITDTPTLTLGAGSVPAHTAGDWDIIYELSPSEKFAITNTMGNANTDVEYLIAAGSGVVSFFDGANLNHQAPSARRSCRHSRRVTGGLCFGKPRRAIRASHRFR